LPAFFEFKDLSDVVGVRETRDDLAEGDCSQFPVQLRHKLVTPDFIHNSNLGLGFTVLDFGFLFPVQLCNKPVTSASTFQDLGAWVYRFRFRFC
jgi:hypothetical protein